MGTLRPTHASIKWPLNKYDPGKGDVGIMKLTAEKSFESDHFMRHPVFAYFVLTSMAAWDFVHLSISIASACFLSCSGVSTCGVHIRESFGQVPHKWPVMSLWRFSLLRPMKGVKTKASSTTKNARQSTIAIVLCCSSGDTGIGQTIGINRL